jgi:hypothetical protein
LGGLLQEEGPPLRSIEEALLLRLLLPYGLRRARNAFLKWPVRYAEAFEGGWLREQSKKKTSRAFSKSEGEYSVS